MFLAFFWQEVYICRVAYPIQFVQTTLPSDHANSIVIGVVCRELQHPDDSTNFNLNYVLQVHNLVNGAIA